VAAAHGQRRVIARPVGPCAAIGQSQRRELTGSKTRGTRRRLIRTPNKLSESPQLTSVGATQPRTSPVRVTLSGGAARAAPIQYSSGRRQEAADEKRSRGGRESQRQVVRPRARLRTTRIRARQITASWRPASGERLAAAHREATGEM